MKANTKMILFIITIFLSNLGQAAEIVVNGRHLTIPINPGGPLYSLSALPDLNKLAQETQSSAQTSQSNEQLVCQLSGDCDENPVTDDKPACLNPDAPLPYELVPASRCISFEPPGEIARGQLDGEQKREIYRNNGKDYFKIGCKLYVVVKQYSMQAKQAAGCGN